MRLVYDELPPKNQDVFCYVRDESGVRKELMYHNGKEWLIPIAYDYPINLKETEEVAAWIDEEGWELK